MFEGVKDFFSGRGRRLGKLSFTDVLISILGLIAFVIIWHLSVIILNTPYLPYPVEVLDAFFRSFSEIDPITGVTMWKNLEASLNRFLVGFLLAAIVAIPIGLGLGWSKIAETAAKPIIEIFRPIPPLAWAPFFFIVFGAFLGPVLVIFLGVLFPILSNVIFGVKSVDPNLLDAAKTLGAKQTDLFLKVIFPYTVPFLMAGVTIGLGIGWMCIVAAEMIGAEGGGVGLFIQNMNAIGRYPEMFAGMAVVAILGIITVGGARYIEIRLSKWMGVSHK
ncbi:MAG: ABC transporter permease [Euryarchaeota archaeon]|nr:ABC transporter permease [Euryarchaeota archaeon]